MKNFNNIFHAASRQFRATRFVFEQNRILFFFEAALIETTNQNYSPIPEENYKNTSHWT